MSSQALCGELGKVYLPSLCEPRYMLNVSDVVFFIKSSSGSPDKMKVVSLEKSRVIHSLGDCNLFN